jgi:hypothetical protein
MVSGQPVRAEIDSGAVVSTLTANAARRVGFKTSPSAAPAGPSVQGLTGAPVQTRVEVFPTFTFGDETIKNAKIEIADMFAAATEVPIGSMLPQTVIEFPEMLLGADFLKSHRVYVAMSQRKVYASYTGGPVFQDRGQTVTRPEPPKP